ncbi:PhaM family polyhydroxyalkanoate granule multifunctional regulatory protein [Pseudoduganella plicata]|uniref:Transcriptional regulator n=1 Tax=Pseudoduganella plicata TaxID=321984 RepID=A0A4P7BK62_9BURK|nr:PhaM family polyhydroxyalkanoate granule multifunctional regulatory protein [Pseudoduganella plicata]QBQ38075.1 hypothetical protein E1742_19205 [Pseudoduganella plicata]GGZ03192.1 hypothetical protein GCM10007388_41040 [Pseudoduganella plicata]
MSTPQMPNIPGAAAMTDTLDFVKNLWGSMGVPGMSLPSLATPTLSVDELDKKISDLKAVESWLNLNTAMLRSSIQALEVQRNTIATLKTMGQTMAEAMQQGRDNPYAAAFFQHADPAKAAAGKAPARPAEEAKVPPKPDAATAATAQMANPAAWWNLLQEQFTQAVSSAVAPDSGGKVSPTSPVPTAQDNSVQPSEASKETAADTAADTDAARKPAARKAGTKPKE